MKNFKHIRSNGGFSKFAKKAAFWTGTPYSFFVALSIVVVWAITGPIFGFNDTWQLVINTGTTIVTFLMVFLIQNAQNRDSLALQVKLDELIRATEKAHNSLLDLEELDERELTKIHNKYLKAAKLAREDMRKRGEFGQEFDVEKGE